jgi:pteridine reductase
VSTVDKPVALVTGGARRVGAAITRCLQQAGYRVYLHYRSSRSEAQALADELNRHDPATVVTLQGDLGKLHDIDRMATAMRHGEGRLDLLVNNASAYYPTPVGATTEAQWDDLMAGNLKGPWFLSQACADLLATAQGSIVNLIDTNAVRPLRGHPVYCMAKAGLLMMTRSLALELAPAIRVNAVAPGTVLWPGGLGPALSEQEQADAIAQIPLQRIGTAEDIARTVLFLARSSYITGQYLAVDGGRML